MICDFKFDSNESYQLFKRARCLPQYSVRGQSIIVPDQYADMLGGDVMGRQHLDWSPSGFLFEHQSEIVKRALREKCFAVFADCGLGKTLILLEFAQGCVVNGKRTLIVSPLMVCGQTADECEKFYGFRPDEIAAADLQSWLDGDGADIGITNYEAIREGLDAGNLGALILDESSMLKSHYGKFGTRLIELGKGIEYKLALTGTPAPNDRIEFANHAVFLGRHRTVNEFLARYFVNRGETANRWELKPHALRPFYRDLSAWCIFVSDPSVYGWQPIGDIPPMHVHIEDVPLTTEQTESIRDLTGSLIAVKSGGIGQRSKLSQIAKGQYKGESISTNKFSHIKSMVEGWPDESVIIWCRFNDEQERLAKTFPDAANIAGSTPVEKRKELIAEFKAGKRQVLISKPKILGFGLNLQVATRQIFSSCDDSYEEFYQAVKRSNRIGSTKPLNVHIAMTEIEQPMVANVLDKASRVESDTKEQEQLFKETAEC
jgi:superfamily II DNA or RNA helicase